MGRRPSDTIEMPAVPPSLSRMRVNVSNNGEEHIHIEENSVCRDWDPTKLINELYKVTILIFSIQSSVKYQPPFLER